MIQFQIRTIRPVKESTGRIIKSPRNAISFPVKRHILTYRKLLNMKTVDLIIIFTLLCNRFKHNSLCLFDSPTESDTKMPHIKLRIMPTPTTRQIPDIILNDLKNRIHIPTWRMNRHFPKFLKCHTSFLYYFFLRSIGQVGNLTIMPKPQSSFWSNPIIISAASERRFIVILVFFHINSERSSKSRSSKTSPNFSLNASLNASATGKDGLDT